ncbi:MAG TPA: DUF2207 domain-containing protein [Thermoanaerobaculia bacterium]|nr:DUF2207 domain-containing protein [Thermoanaerobaculia bacterium]
MDIAKVEARSRTALGVRGVLGVAVGLLLSLAAPAAAEEQILRFDSHVTIAADGGLRVRETIVVNAEGVDIQRGIYRDFPLDYSGPFGTRVRVPFRVVEVKRDGAPEPHHSENLSNGVRIYIGSASVLLDPGAHEYQLTYETGRQIGFFEEHDELYWNVTGNDWDFPILEATATVELPPGVAPDAIGHEAYTGFQGEQGREYSSRIDEQGRVQFATTRPLARQQGLTLVVTFPKGVVREPTEEERRRQFFEANRSLIPAAATLVTVLGYYLVVWWKVGRDPQRGVVIPLFDPPDDLAPAATRFVWRMGFDRKCFTAALLDMAAKGFLRIVEGDTFRLEKAGGTTALLSEGERTVASYLLPSRSFELKPRDSTTAARMKKTIGAFHRVLRRQYEGEMFRTNRKWLLVGFGLSLLGLAATALASGVREASTFGVVVLFAGLWTFVSVLLLIAASRAWAQFAGARGLRKVGALLPAVLVTLAMIPITGLGVVLLLILASMSGFWLPGLILALPILGAIFYVLLRQPSQAGRKLMDRIEGFRMYLSTAERDELRTAEPEMTVERYELLLPYAVALGVENEWSEKLASALALAGQSPPESGPRWYSGPSWSKAGAAGFGSAIGGALAGAVASAATPPGSSSGSGGGGSSGGGGGGGGGGGW